MNEDDKIMTWTLLKFSSKINFKSYLKWLSLIYGL